jgi:hypothetical protein
MAWRFRLPDWGSSSFSLVDPSVIGWDTAWLEKTPFGRPSPAFQWSLEACVHLGNGSSTGGRRHSRYVKLVRAKDLRTSAPSRPSSPSRITYHVSLQNAGPCDAELQVGTYQRYDPRYGFRYPVGTVRYVRVGGGEPMRYAGGWGGVTSPYHLYRFTISTWKGWFASKAP